MIDPRNKAEIWEILKSADTDLSTGEIADRSNVSRRTAKKWLYELRDEGRIKVAREVGQVKMYAPVPEQERRKTHEAQIKNT